MQSYLKTKPVWMQLLIFTGMAIGVFVGVGWAGGSILSAITGLDMYDLADVSKWDISNPKMITYVRGMLLIQFLGLFVIPSLLFAYFSDPKPLKYIGLKKPIKPIFWIIGIAALFLAIPLVEYTGLLNRKIDFGSAQQWMKNMEDEAAQQIKFMLGKQSPSELVLNVIFIALFAGVGEELFFRGIVQRLFIKGTRSHWAGIIITAVLFSALHIQFFGFVPRVLLGVLLGAIYWYSGSLWTAIAAHFIYDAFFIVLSYYQPSILENQESTLINQSMLSLLALVSTALVILLVWLMKRNSNVTYTTVYKNDQQDNYQDFSF